MIARMLLLLVLASLFTHTVPETAWNTPALRAVGLAGRAVCVAPCEHRLPQVPEAPSSAHRDLFHHGHCHLWLLIALTVVALALLVPSYSWLLRPNPRQLLLTPPLPPPRIALR